MKHDFDGKSLLNSIMMAKAKQDGEQDIYNVLAIFDKYGLSFADGIAMLLELSAVMDGEKKDGDNNNDG